MCGTQGRYASAQIWDLPKSCVRGACDKQNVKQKKNVTKKSFTAFQLRAKRCECGSKLSRARLQGLVTGRHADEEMEREVVEWFGERSAEVQAKIHEKKDALLPGKRPREERTNVRQVRRQVQGV